jgi:hypothetical protein
MLEGMGAAGPSAGRWLAERRHLNASRRALALAALALYPDAPRVEGTPLLSGPGWVPEAPVDLGALALCWSDPPAPAVTGRERPPAYSESLAALDRPRLLENRPSYRLLEVDWAAPRLTFGPGRYFDVIDLCEAVAHELAARDLAGGCSLTPPHLPLRARIGDPFDLARRPVLPAMAALTLRRDRAADSATFVLHSRDASRVSSGGGLLQVLPVGMFQPSGDSPEDAANDFDLWRGMVRELSEELLDVPEHRSRPGAPIDYGAWPFHRELQAARARGAVRVWCLGLGIDPLTLAADLLFAVVIDAGVYDALIGPAATSNEEGAIVRSLDGGAGGGPGIPFARETIDEITSNRPMQPAGAALLRLAWRHRETLLG